MVMLTSHTGVDKINEDCLQFRRFLLNCFFHCIRTKDLCNFYINSLKLRRRQWHPTPVLLPGKSHGGAR